MQFPRWNHSMPNLVLQQIGYMPECCHTSKRHKTVSTPAWMLQLIPFNHTLPHVKLWTQHRAMPDLIQSVQQVLSRLVDLWDKFANRATLFCMVISIYIWCEHINIWQILLATARWQPAIKHSKNKTEQPIWLFEGLAAMQHRRTSCIGCKAKL